MVTAYQPSGVEVNVLDNPNFINTGGETRLPALIGMGPMTLIAYDEAVVRGTGSVDVLANSAATINSISKIANNPGVVTGSVDYQLISNNGSLYDSSKAAITNPGKVTWSAGANTPSIGDVYYITYVYDVLSSQFDPKTLSDKVTIQGNYGNESNTNGILTVGGSIVLENGSPAVMCVQASGSSYNETAYKNAIDRLKKKTNVEQLVVLFPSGSVTKAQQETLLTYAYTHVQTMSNNGKERGLITGSPSPYFASDGIDAIGDASTPNTFVYRAAQLKNRNVVYVVPSRVRRKDQSGNYMELDANFAAAAVAGLQLGQRRFSTPIHGFTLTGIEIENEKWDDFQMNQLGGGGCLVLESRSNIVTIRDAITTDRTSADTEEVSVVSLQRLVKRTLRDTLKNTYTNKGKTVTPTTGNDIEATTASTFQVLIRGGEIAAYGREDNPITGEVQIRAQRDSSEPRRFFVTASYSPLYPLKWITVTVSVYI